MCYIKKWTDWIVHGLNTKASVSEVQASVFCLILWSRRTAQWVRASRLLSYWKLINDGFFFLFVKFKRCFAIYLCYYSRKKAILEKRLFTVNENVKWLLFCAVVSFIANTDYIFVLSCNTVLLWPGSLVFICRKHNLCIWGVCCLELAPFLY